MNFDIWWSLYIRGLFSIIVFIIRCSHLFNHGISHNLMPSLCHNRFWCLDLHLRNLTLIVKSCLRIKLVTTVCFGHISLLHLSMSMLLFRTPHLFNFGFDFGSDKWFNALAVFIITQVMAAFLCCTYNRWTHAFCNSFKFIIYFPHLIPNLPWIVYCLKKRCQIKIFGNPSTSLIKLFKLFASKAATPNISH